MLEALSDFILTLVTLQRLLDEDWKDAAGLLQFIEKQMPQTLDPSTPPRSFIRELDALARVKPTQFSSSHVPSPSTLQEMREVAETAVRYAREFCWVSHGLARLRFYSGDAEGALNLIDDCLAHNAKAKSDVFMLLAKAFLEFYSLRWATACDYFRRVLDHPDVFRIRWEDDLVPFAKYAEEIGTEGATVIQTLYARLGNCGALDETEQAAVRWIEADATRRQFRELLDQAPRVWASHHAKAGVSEASAAESGDRRGSKPASQHTHQPKRAKRRRRRK